MNKRIEMDWEQDITEFTDDETRRNPIHLKLKSYEGPLSPDLLNRVVARSRDFFHTFVSTTLRRRYRRIVPIYLIDDWVVNALGVFISRGGRRLPAMGPEDKVFDPAHPQVAQVQFSGVVEGLEHLLAMFDGLAKVQALLGGAQILSTGAMIETLTAACQALAGNPRKAEEIRHVCAVIEDLIERATATLLGEPSLQQSVNEKFLTELKTVLHALVSAAERASAAPSPLVPGTGFGPGRWSGVLFGSIPALKINGPAILIAPKAITQWALGFHHLHWITRGMEPAAMDTWFGVQEPEHRAVAVGLSNVVQHELTHAMVALPNDAVEDFEVLFRERWRFYDRAPGFEEGLCDITAAIATTVALLKVRFGISGRNMPRLHEGKYAEAWKDFFPAIAETYADYYGRETDTWRRAWENNKRDFGAFSGLVKLYSTNFSGIDWEKTFREFEDGRISTGVEY